MITNLGQTGWNSKFQPVWCEFSEVNFKYDVQIKNSNNRRKKR